MESCINSEVWDKQRTRRRTVWVVSDRMAPQVLAKVHNNGGHFGAEKALNRVSKRFWWPGYTRVVESYVATCKVSAKEDACKES